ncbi:MAG: DUF4328 domain-containing protein [Dysgonomonas sp.]
MSGLRPNEQRGKIAIALIWVIFSINGFSLVLNVATEIYNKVYGVNISAAIFTIYQYLFVAISLSLIILVITSVVVFLKWFRRAYYNLDVLTNECMYDNSWSVKGWFIPFMNLYVPYQIMKELFEKTDRYLMERYLSQEMAEPYTDRLNTGVLKWWWATAIIVFLFVYTLHLLITWFAPIHMYWIVLNLFTVFIRTAFIMGFCLLSIFVIKNYQKAEKLIYDYNTNSHE